MSLIQDASLAMIPSGYSNGTLHSLLPEVKTLSQELITNGGFDLDESWLKFNGATISGGVANLPSSTNPVIQQALSTQAGKKYKIYVESEDFNNDFYICVGTGVGTGLTNRNILDIKGNSGSFEAIGSTTYIGVRNLSSSNSYKIDSVSVKEIDRLPGDFTFSRGSNLAATRVNADGLIEKGRENLLIYSNNLNIAPWASGAATLTYSQLGRDGLNNAWLYENPTPTSAILINTALTGLYTLSFYVKKENSKSVKIYNFGDTNQFCTINIQDGTLVSGSTTTIFSAESYNNDWWRVSATMNVSNGKFYLYIGDGTQTQIQSSLIVQDFQIELGSVATDYIPTNGSTGKAGVLENTPRLNYEGSCPYLLLEPARTNLIPYSEDFSNAGWTKAGNVVLDPNSVISPDGTQNATKITGLNGNGENDLRYEIPINPASKTYTFSVYLKGSGTLRMQLGNFVNQAFEKTITLTPTWERHSLTCTFNATTTSSLVPNLDDYFLKTATEYDIWGAQVELGSYATSYIPTYGTIQTRSGDACTGAGDSSVFNDSEGVLFVDLAAFETTTIKGISVTGSSSINRATIYFNSSSQIVGYYFNAGTPVGGFNGGIQNFTNQTKIALKYKTDDFALFVNGSKVSVDPLGTTLSAEVFDRLSFSSFGASEPFYGKVKSLIYFPTALTDDELQALTSSNINEVLRTYKGKLSFIDATYEGGLVDSNLTNLF